MKVDVAKHGQLLTPGGDIPTVQGEVVVGRGSGR